MAAADAAQATNTAQQQLGQLHLAAADTSTSTPSTTTSTSTSMRAAVHCFTEQAPDAVIHFQVVDLGLQLYVWLGVGGAKLQNMYLAIQSKQSGVPSVATLLPDGTSSTTSSLAQRLARRVGRPVVCSCNLPQNSDTLQVLAERRLIQELKQLGLVNDSAPPTAASGAAAPIAAAAAAAAGAASLESGAAGVAQQPSPTAS